MPPLPKTTPPPVVPPEPPVVVAPLVPLFCKTTVPVVGLVPCGVMFSCFPETQNEYLASLSSVTTLPEVVYWPRVDAPRFTKPIQPVWLTVAEHVQPPLAADVHMVTA